MNAQTEETLKFLSGNPDWGQCYVDDGVAYQWPGRFFESGVLKGNALYAGSNLKDAQNQDITFARESGIVQMYTIEFDETPALKLQICVNCIIPNQFGGGHSTMRYKPLVVENNVATFTVDVNDCTFTGIGYYGEEQKEFTNEPQDVTSLTLQMCEREATYPATISIKSIKRGIIYPTSTATPNSNNTANWGTYSNNLANVQLSGDGVEVYNVTIDGEKLKFIKRADNIVAKGEGVIVKSSTNSFSVAVIESASKKEGENLLKATPTTSQTITSDGETLYYLTKDYNHKLGFYRGADDGKSLPNAQPGKAYLAISNTSQLSKTRSIDIDDPETTDIEGVKAERVQHDAIYNLAGQRVGKLSKGINIVGNKKVLVK